jgi:hypothetical protein
MLNEFKFQIQNTQKKNSKFLFAKIAKKEEEDDEEEKRQVDGRRFITTRAVCACECGVPKRLKIFAKDDHTRRGSHGR